MRQECGNTVLVSGQGLLQIRTLREMFAHLIDRGVEDLKSPVLGLTIGERLFGEVRFHFFERPNRAICIKRLAESVTFGFDNLDEHIERADKGESR